MRRTIVWLCAVLLACATAGAADAARSPKTPKTAPAKAKFERTSILVKFAAPGAVRQTVSQLGDTVLSTTLTGATLVGLDRKDVVAKKVAQYKKLPGVVYAEPNFIAHAALASPNDPSYGSQWALSKIDAIDGWALSPGSFGARDGVKIAIVDTGIQSAHPEFSDGRIVSSASANCVNSTDTCTAGPAEDDNGHGTHVAGIAGAATNNGTGVAGEAFASSLIPVKVLDATAYGSYAAIANGIMWAAQHGARAMNLSIGGSAYSQTLCDAVNQAIGLGTVVVASAGNDSSSAANYPAACPGAIGVAATDSNDARASFSNYGSPDVFVSAPGASIYSTYTGSSYKTMSGTSMAAPFVTGLAALLLGQVPTRTVADVKNLLATTSDKVGGSYGSDPYKTCVGCTWSSDFGYGRIDVYRALAAAGRDFALGASPTSAATPAGGAASYTLTVTAVNGFSGTVSLSAAGAPAGATATVSPASVTGSGSSQLRVTTSTLTPPGSYTIVVSGQSGTLAHTVSVTLQVTAPSVVLPPVPAPPVPVPTVPVPTVPVPAPVPVPPVSVPPVSVPPVPTSTPSLSSDFSVSASASQIVRTGEPAAYTVTLSATNGANLPISLGVTGLPPGTTAATFVPTSATAPGAAALTVATSLATPPGTYTLTITASGGGYTHSTTATLIVKALA